MDQPSRPTSSPSRSLAPKPSLQVVPDAAGTHDQQSSIGIWRTVGRPASLAARSRAVAAVAASALAATATAGLLVVSNGAPAGAAEAVRDGGRNVQDTFARTVRHGLGSAPTGGVWTVRQSKYTSTRRGTAAIGPLRGGRQVVATLRGVYSVNQSVTMSFKVAKLPRTNAGLLVMASTRVQPTGDAIAARLKIGSAGAPWLSLVRITKGKTFAVSGRIGLARLKANHTYSLQVQAYGTAPVRTSARAWPAGSRRPSWQVSATVTHPSVPKTAGGVGFVVYNANRSPARIAIESVLGNRVIVTRPPRSLPTSKATPRPQHSTSIHPTGAPTVPPIGDPAPTTAAPSSSAPTSSEPTSSPTPTPTTPAPASTAPAGPSPRPVMPDATSTGVPAGTKLRVVYGRITAATPGQVIDGVDLHGDVVVAAANVVIRNSIIRGVNATKMSCVVFSKDPAVRNLQISNVEIVPEYINTYQGAGICGGNFTASNVNIHDTVDGIKIHGDNVAIRNSYIHDLRWFENDPGNSGPSHSDGVQVLGCRGLTLTGNAIYGGRNSALQVSQEYSVVTNLLANGNLFYDHDSYPIKLNNKPYDATDTFMISNNYFGSYVTKQSWAIIAAAKVSFVSRNNVWMDTGKVAPSVVASS